MTDKKWYYYTDHNEEIFYGGFDTMHEAVSKAQLEADVYSVVHAGKKELELCQFVDDFYRLIEDAEQDAVDKCHSDEDGNYLIFDLDQKQMASLETAIKIAIRSWQKENDIKFYSWCLIYEPSDVIHFGEQK